MMRVPMNVEIIEIPERITEAQVRKHRKKRINKKWRKRYGVKLAVDLNCYLYEEHGKIKVFAPKRVAQKLRDDIALAEMGVIDGMKFRVAGKDEPANISFRHQGGLW
ncbi:MAG: hypothetical protein IKJ99_03615 [Oscillospiraceae bacterium]|nr:hypothetical protein [Oscillospiraceae bacterium]